MTGNSGGDLREWRRSRGWDVPELARQLRRAASEPVAAHDALVRMIRAWERGDHHPSERYELLYRKLGLIPPGDNDQLEAHPADTASQEDSDPVRRRTFVELTGISAAAALLPVPAATRPPLDTEPLALALTAQMTGVATGPTEEPPGIAALTLSVTRARTHYQACRYSELITRLPRLLAQLDAACGSLDGDDKLCAYALAADAYHLAAGILLKTGDHGLAHLATDRSMTAALASHDPLTVGTSARIVTHTLASSGHLQAAIATARNHSQRLDPRDRHAHPGIPVGIWLGTAPRCPCRRPARRPRHRPRDARRSRRRRPPPRHRREPARYRLRPGQCALHQVNVAVTLGDAGTAIDLARQIDLAAITVTERKASLLIDVAQAFFQWGKYDQAYTALRAAEQTAPRNSPPAPRSAPWPATSPPWPRPASATTPGTSPTGSARTHDTERAGPDRSRVRRRPRGRDRHPG